MSSSLEDRVRLLTDRAIAAKTQSELDAILPELKAAIRDYIRYLRAIAVETVPEAFRTIAKRQRNQTAIDLRSVLFDNIETLYDGFVRGACVDGIFNSLTSLEKRGTLFIGVGKERTKHLNLLVVCHDTLAPSIRCWMYPRRCHTPSHCI